MKDNNVKYMLVLEKRPFDYMPINIGLLDVSDGQNYYTFPEIDAFTQTYNKQEIIDSVSRSNTITNSYLSGELNVIEIIDGNNKYLHKYPAMTNELVDGFDIVDYIYNNFDDKNLMNMLMVKYSNLVEDEVLKKAIRIAYQVRDIKTIISYIYMMPYAGYRELICYLAERNPKEEELLTRKKVA